MEAASYATRQGEVRAVSDVSFSLRRGEVLGPARLQSRCRCLDFCRIVVG